MIVNEQIGEEVKEINKKRDASEKGMQEAKNKLAESYIQIRQLNSVITN